MNLGVFLNYFITQWLSPPFDQWQLFRRSAGYPTTAINEPFNKEIKETWTKYKASTILHVISETLPSICLFYIIHDVPFTLYPDSQNMCKDIIQKASKYTANQFVKYDFNYFIFKGISKTTGMAYRHYIRCFFTY